MTIIVIVPELFTAHEIDVGLFMTMREVDLVNLGVDRFGPRRKMMALIAGEFSYGVLFDSRLIN